MRRTAGLLLFLSWAVVAWSQGLPSTLDEQPHLELTAAQVAQTPWLVVGPLARAWKVTLELQGPGFRRSVDLPVLVGQAATWSVPLPPGTRSVRLLGAWQRTATPLRLAKAPSGTPSEGLNITALQGTQGQQGYRVRFPVWHTADGYTPLLNMTVRSQSGWQVEVSDLSSALRFDVSPGVSRWSFAPQAYDLEPREVTVWTTGPDPTFALQELQPTGLPPGLPIPADAHTLLTWPAASWRTPTHEWFSWSPAPSVLVLVSRTYQEQDAWFKRLAFFVEKAGYRGKILSDDQLAVMHGWNAHDYQASDLAEFYNLALAQGAGLTPQEHELRDRLERAGILVASGTNTWRAGEGAVLGVSVESPPALRSMLFTHEAFHGLFFTNSDFRQVTRDLWNQLSEAARTTVREFLAPAKYDTTFDSLVINEFQAYLLQQEAHQTGPYLASRLVSRAMLDASTKKLALADLSAAARTLETSVGRLFGVRGGEVRTVRPWAGKTTK